MGGTRCVFRKCVKNSYNSPNMHFFQFPVKDKERFNLWAKYAKADFIFDLTLQQKKNKRICEDHFRDECFMNYKKNRLIPSAVPTLDRLENNLVLDYEQSENPSPMELSIAELPEHLIPPPHYVKSKEIVENETCTYNIAFDSLDDYQLISTNENDSGLNDLPPQAKMIKQYVTAKMITNKTPPVKSYSASQSILKRKSALEAGKRASGISTEQTTYDSSGLSFENESDFELSSPTEVENRNENVIEDQNTGTNENQDENLNGEIENNENLEIIDGEYIIEEDEEGTKSEPIDSTLQWYLEEINRYKRLLDKEMEISSAALDEVDRLLKNPSKVQTLIPSNKPSTSQGPLTKIRLFNGIKKYLSPSMLTLVQMEMFAAPEREWKSDEKEISKDLLRLGDNVFNFFRDEWRIRLPPKKDVQKWLNEFDNSEADEEL